MTSILVLFEHHSRAVYMLARLVSMHCPSSHCAGQRLAQASALCLPSHSLAAPLSHPLRHESTRQRSSRLIVRMGSSGKFFVGGNWKSNGTKESVKKLVQDLNSAQVPSDIDVIVAPTFLQLPYVVENIKDRFQVSAQNCWVGKAGAYTGEVRTSLPHTQTCTCNVRHVHSFNVKLRAIQETTTLTLATILCLRTLWR